MRRHFFWIAILLALPLAMMGCDKKDGEPNASSASSDPFVGKWAVGPSAEVQVNANGTWLDPSRKHDQKIDACRTAGHDPGEMPKQTWSKVEDSKYELNQITLSMQISGGQPSDCSWGSSLLKVVVDGDNLTLTTPSGRTQTRRK